MTPAPSDRSRCAEHLLRQALTVYGAVHNKHDGMHGLGELPDCPVCDHAATIRTFLGEATTPSGPGKREMSSEEMPTLLTGELRQQTGAADVCTATSLHALSGLSRCVQPAGHYDQARWPNLDSPDGLPEVGGWHASGLATDRTRLVWNDRAHGSTPHGASVESAVEGRPGFRCATCGPTTVEQHPHVPEVMRCVNCREFLERRPLRNPGAKEQ